MISPHPSRPITVTLVDDYDVVLTGLAHMFDDYRDRILVSEIDSNAALDDTVDIVMYDSFAQPESDHEELSTLVGNPKARNSVSFQPAPTPNTNRPPAISSTVAACLASSAGLWKFVQATSGPSSSPSP